MASTALNHQHGPTKSTDNIRLAVSIKLLKTGYPIEEYRKVYSDLITGHLTQYPELFYECLYEELDKHGILHLHGVLLAPKKFFRCNLLRAGYNINVKPIQNEFGWSMYMTNYGVNKLFDQFNVPNANYSNTIVTRVLQHKHGSVPPAG